jgi:coenzyme F420-0:L-glutamate ligase/coenzyme F420-1:gamma-L-glutamate ligase
MGGMQSLTIAALDNFPMVRPGDDLAPMIAACAASNGLALREGDVVVIAQKIVSKAEGRIARLSETDPSPRALKLAKITRKDPRLVELVLRESVGVVRAKPDLLVVEHRNGYVHANAGIDQSNVGAGDAEDHVLLLPADADESARRLRDEIKRTVGLNLGIVINDSMGRAWRLGVIGTAIGVAGVPALIDKRGQPDLFGRALLHTEIGHADELAAAASLLQGQSDEGRPVVIIRGLAAAGEPGRAADLIRPKALDAFR